MSRYPLGCEKSVSTYQDVKQQLAVGMKMKWLGRLVMALEANSFKLAETGGTVYELKTLIG